MIGAVLLRWCLLVVYPYLCLFRCVVGVVVLRLVVAVVVAGPLDVAQLVAQVSRVSETRRGQRTAR